MIDWLQVATIAEVTRRLKWIDAHRVYHHLPRPQPDGHAELVLSPPQPSSAWPHGCCRRGVTVCATTGLKPRLELWQAVTGLVAPQARPASNRCRRRAAALGVGHFLG